jgi:hypothetical protein
VIIFGCGNVKFSVLHEGEGLLLAIFACLSWEMALNVRFKMSFYNMQDWKGI